MKSLFIFGLLVSVGFASAQVVTGEGGSPENGAQRWPGRRAPMQFPKPGPPPQAQTAPTQPNPQPQAAPVQLQPQAAEVPPTRPASPPQVTYSGGQLTVVADNSTLSDVLTAIERATGAKAEGTTPGSERVFGTFGPGSPRDVLNSLLTGSRYDYILMGSLQDPADVQRIVLSPHQGGAAGAATAAGNQPGARPLPTPSSEDDDNEGIVTPQPIEQAPPPTVETRAPNPNQQPVTAQPTQTEQGQQPQQQQVKTPEQLLQELQRLRQQQVQQNQQQNQYPR